MGPGTRTAGSAAAVALPAADAVATGLPASRSRPRQEGPAAHLDRNSRPLGFSPTPMVAFTLRDRTSIADPVLAS
jgi:hypothetical protein